MPEDASPPISMNDRLLLSLSAAGRPEGLVEAVASSLGRFPDEMSADTSTPVLGFLLRELPEVLSVMVVTDRLMSVVEVNYEGASLQVSIPLERVRRASRLEDSMGCLVTVEIEADRSSATTEMLESGESRTVQYPAGYELRASDPQGMRELREFHLMLVRAL